MKGIGRYKKWFAKPNSMIAFVVSLGKLRSLAGADHSGKSDESPFKADGNLQKLRKF